MYGSGKHGDKDLADAYRDGSVDQKLDFLMTRVGSIEDKIDSVMYWKAWVTGIAVGVSFLMSVVFKWFNGRG